MTYCIKPRRIAFLATHIFIGKHAPRPAGKHPEVRDVCLSKGNTVMVIAWHPEDRLAEIQTANGKIRYVPKTALKEISRPRKPNPSSLEHIPAV